MACKRSYGFGLLGKRGNGVATIVEVLGRSLPKSTSISWKSAATGSSANSDLPRLSSFPGIDDCYRGQQAIDQ
jgi:hypothetical protein